MSTIVDEKEPRRESAFIYPMWLVMVYEKEEHTNGQSYYVRAPNAAMGIVRALALHPEELPFEKVVVTDATTFMVCESGYGLET